MTESRPYWLLEGHAECGELRCAEGPGRAWSALAGAETGIWVMVGPWQYQCTGSTPPMYPPGIPPSRYPSCPHVGVTVPLHHATGSRTLGTCTYGRFSMVQGDPRGGIRACYLGDGYQLPHVTIPPLSGTPSQLLIVPAAGPCSGPWSMNLVLEHEPGPGA